MFHFIWLGYNWGHLSLQYSNSRSQSPKLNSPFLYSWGLPCQINQEACKLLTCIYLFYPASWWRRTHTCPRSQELSMTVDVSSVPGDLCCHWGPPHRRESHHCHRWKSVVSWDWVFSSGTASAEGLKVRTEADFPLLPLPHPHAEAHTLGSSTKNGPSFKHAHKRFLRVFDEGEGLLLLHFNGSLINVSSLIKWLEFH